MGNDEVLLDILIERLDRSGLSPEQQALVWSAFEGDEQFAQAVAGSVELEPFQEQAAGESKDQPHAYLETITVCGFRGVGPEATLRLVPGPGLTLVVGRNGSGKSSFAEGAEVALTGTSYRWKDKTKEWKTGWRNLHQTDATSVEIGLVVDGDRGRTMVRRWWSGHDLDSSDCSVQRPGQPRAALSTLGWDSALATYRPFLSYSELGQTLTGRPSEMYDAVAAILGLEQIAEAERRLTEARKELESVAKELDRDLQPLLSQLRQVDDDRARLAYDGLTARRRDLTELADLAAGTSRETRSDEIDLLRLQMQVAAPDQDRVAAAADGLRRAADGWSAVRGTAADESRHTADLLQRALEHHERHLDDRTCPVCGTRDALGPDWAQASRDRIDQLRRAAAAAEAALRQVTERVAAVKERLTLPPGWVRDDSALHATWTAWAAGAGIDDPRRLADHVERTLPAFARACEEVRSEAARRHTELEDRWQPVAIQLASWIDRAWAVEAQRETRDDVKKALDWLRDVGLDLRNDRLRPLADQSSAIWQQLRQESNVGLGPITLAGRAAQRRVALDVTVDGIDGTALGVMSQGELHALALALFLPRATLPESPFGFLVIDDPVQSMDPAKVDGLARVLSETASERQVIVFTHDTRLPDAVRRLNLPATVWEVVRRENSVVELRKADDPVKRAIADARALLATRELPDAVADRVVPGLCRTALEAALVEGVWRRRLADGGRHAVIDTEIAGARGPYELAALAFFGDQGRASEVLARINNRFGRWAGDTFKECRSAGHEAYGGDLHGLVDRTERLVERIRGDR